MMKDNPDPFWSFLGRFIRGVILPVGVICVTTFVYLALTGNTPGPSEAVHAEINDYEVVEARIEDGNTVFKRCKPGDTAQKECDLVVLPCKLSLGVSHTGILASVICGFGHIEVLSYEKLDTTTEAPAPSPMDTVHGPHPGYASYPDSS